MRRAYFIKLAFFATALSMFFASANAQKIKVACVGDSITAGAGIKDKASDSYPAVLGAMLGDKYEVKNCGVSGRTLLKSGDKPYWDAPHFKKAKAFEPNIVIIKLGTNDSKPQNWKHKDEFKRDLLSLISEFQAMDSKPQIYLCTPMFVAKPMAGISNEVVRDEVAPIIRQVAKEKNLELIEIYSAFTKDAALLPDGVHPNEAGAKKLAGVICKALTRK